MTRNIAVIDATGQVIAINVHDDDYVPTFYEREVSGAAWVGGRYLSDADVFIPPKPFPSWTLDADHEWQPPTPMPEEGRWYWDEATLSWVSVSA